MNRISRQKQAASLWLLPAAPRGNASTACRFSRSKQHATEDGTVTLEWPRRNFQLGTDDVRVKLTGSENPLHLTPVRKVEVAVCYSFNTSRRASTTDKYVYHSTDKYVYHSKVSNSFFNLWRDGSDVLMEGQLEPGYFVRPLQKPDKDLQLYSLTKLFEGKEGPVQATGHFSVELLLIVDSFFYGNFDNDSSMVTHLKSVVDDANSAFGTLYPPIYINLTGILRYKKEEDDPWFITHAASGYTVDQSLSLDLFTQYWGMNPLVSKYDVALALSGRPMDEGFLGMAYIEGACNSLIHFGIVTDAYHSGFHQTLAHELAHTLGARHDDEDCDSSEVKIMGSHFNKEKTFSRCSANSIWNFLNTPSASCLRQKNIPEFFPLLLDPNIPKSSAPKNQAPENSKLTLFCRKQLKSKTATAYGVEGDPCKVLCYSTAQNATYDMPPGSTCGYNGEKCTFRRCIKRS